jgi:hypothetical protein
MTDRHTGGNNKGNQHNQRRNDDCPASRPDNEQTIDLQFSKVSESKA